MEQVTVSDKVHHVDLRGLDGLLHLCRRLPGIGELVVVFSCPVRGKMGVVGWGWVGHGPGAPGVEVAKVIGKGFQLISCHVRVVPQHLIVARSAGSLDAFMAEQVEVSFSGMVDT